MPQTHDSWSSSPFSPKILNCIHGSEIGSETEETLFKGVSLFLTDHLTFSHLSFPALFQAREKFSLGHFHSM